jgi:putative copper export protein
VSGDGLSWLLFADRIGLNVFAVLTLGFALHAASGVVEREAFKSLRSRVSLASVGLAFFVAIRLGVLIAQMGDGSNPFDAELLPLAWMALGDSTLLVAVGALAAAGGVWFGSGIVAALGAIGISAGFALTGHAQGLTDPGLAPVMVAAHVLIAGFWVVAPFSLYPAKALPDAQLLARLNRFSAIAVAAIPILVGLGVWLAWILTGGPEKLLGTTYGLLLLAKLAIGVVAMGLGALNKQIITAKVATDPAIGRTWLRTPSDGLPTGRLVDSPPAYA